MRGFFLRFVITTVCLISSTALGHEGPVLVDGGDDAPATEASRGLCEKLLNMTAPGVWRGKTLVFDTNIVINDPEAIFRFPGARIIIPGVLFDELEKHKSDQRIGRAARQFSRTMDSLRRKGKMNRGVVLDNEATVQTDSNDYTWILKGKSYAPDNVDNQILAMAYYYLHDAADPNSVYLISDEFNLKNKADDLDILAESLEYDLSKEKTAVDTIPSNYTNYVTATVTDQELREFQESGFVPKPDSLHVMPNQFVMFKTETTEGSQETLARYFYDRENPALSGLKKLRDFSELPIKPKNLEQAMLLDVLMDPSIHLVISQSPAGTGKTFLAIVAGLLQLNSTTNPYDKLMITRTLVQIGRTELGAMPGEMEKKLGHWNISVVDALEALSKASKDQKAQTSVAPVKPEEFQDLQKKLTRSQRRENRRRQEQSTKQGSAKGFSVSKDRIKLVPFPHLRGRSITDSFLILDEAQNTSVHEIKTFLTRAGEGSKMVILGDATQIDSPFLNERNNGLTVTTNLILNDDSLEGRSLVAHVELTEGVRSLLAEYARLLFEKL